MKLGYIGSALAAASMVAASPLHAQAVGSAASASAMVTSAEPQAGEVAEDSDRRRRRGLLFLLVGAALLILLLVLLASDGSDAEPQPGPPASP